MSPRGYSLRSIIGADVRGTSMREKRRDRDRRRSGHRHGTVSPVGGRDRDRCRAATSPVGVHPLAGVVAAITLVVYLPALRNGFVNWDDDLYVYENPRLRASSGPGFVAWALFGFHEGNWQPLTWLSHALDYAVWGLTPLGHHLTSASLHALNAGLVTLLAAELVAIAGVRAHGGEISSAIPAQTARRIAAVVAGLAFGLHPLHVESAAWVSERKDVLCAFFDLLALRSYLRHVEEAPAGSIWPWFGRRNYVTALGFFVLALLSKPMAVSLPIVLLILDWCPLERLRSVRRDWRIVSEKLPFFALALGSALLDASGAERGRRPGPQRDRAASVAADRCSPVSPRLREEDRFASGPVALLPPSDRTLVGLEWVGALPVDRRRPDGGRRIGRRSHPGSGRRGLLQPAVTLLPVLGFVQVGQHAMADRFTYLPSPECSFFLELLLPGPGRRSLVPGVGAPRGARPVCSAGWRSWLR